MFNLENAELQRAGGLANHDHHLAEVVVETRRAINTCGGHVSVLTRPTGSAHYGKVTPADFDVLALIRTQDAEGNLGTPEDLDGFINQMAACGWADCGQDGDTSGGDTDSEDYRATWCALRKGQVNIIATTDLVWFYRQAAASELCRAIAQHEGDELSKERVIGLFRVVREGIVEESTDVG